VRVMEELFVYIKFIDYYKLKIKAETDVLNYFKTNLVATNSKPYKVKKKGKTVLKTRYTKVPVFTEVEDSIVVDAGLIDYIASFLSYLSKRGVRVNLNLNLPKLDPIVISDRWIKILNNPDYEYQSFCVNNLVRYYGGIADLFTSAGKTEMMLSIAECCDMKSVILVPNTKAGIPNIVNRAKKYGIDISSVIDTKAKINVINPIGLLNSGVSKNENILKYLNGIEMCITDEGHHLSATSYRQFFDMMPNVKRSYAFSATPDVSKGMLYSVVETGIPQLSFNQTKIMGLSGSVKARVESPIEAILVKVFCDTGYVPPEEWSWMTALNEFTSSMDLAKMIQKLLNNKFPQVKFYVPIFKAEMGIELYNNLNRLGIPCVFWSSKKILPKEVKVSKKAELDCISDAMTYGNYRVLISTTVSFEIVDIKALGGIIPLYGSNYRMTVQPIGRAARGRKVIIVLFYDSSNSLILSQMKKRRVNIESTYNIVDKMDIRI